MMITSECFDRSFCIERGVERAYLGPLVAGDASCKHGLCRSWPPRRVANRRAAQASANLDLALSYSRVECSMLNLYPSD